MLKKIVTLLFLPLLFIATGCDDEALVHTIEKPEGLQAISGNVAGWNESSDKILLFGYGENEIFGATKIARSGDFNVTLTEPEEDLLTPLNLFPAGGVSTNTLKYSKSGIKAVVGSFYVYQPGTQQPVGQIYKLSSALSEEIATVGPWFSVQYMYVNDNVTITGREVCLYNFSEGNVFSITQDVNLKLVKGWNKIIYRSINSDKKSSTIEVSNTEPSGGNWYYDTL